MSVSKSQFPSKEQTEFQVVMLIWNHSLLVLYPLSRI